MNPKHFQKSTSMSLSVKETKIDKLITKDVEMAVFNELMNFTGMIR